jgi:hypothetical protein
MPQDSFNTLSEACRDTGSIKPSVDFYPDGVTAVDVFRWLWRAARQPKVEADEACRAELAKACRAELAKPPCVTLALPKRVAP